MKKSWMASLGGLLAGTMAYAQESLLPPAEQSREPEKVAVAQAEQIPAPQEAAKPAVVNPAQIITQAACCNFDCCCEPTPRFWGRAEFILWWWTDGPNPTPLVTTTDNLGGANPGAIGDPGTAVLLGQNDIEYGAHPGARISGGLWNRCGTLGVEASGFWATQRTERQTFVTDPAGNPPLFAPFADLNGQEDAEAIAFGIPGLVAPGSVAFSSSSELWGAEVNAVANLTRNSCWTVDALLGARYLDLNEKLRLDYANQIFVGGVFDETNLGFDDFGTRNRFYGGQLGSRIAYRNCRVSAELVAKVAVGNTRQELDINGETASLNAAGQVVDLDAGAIFTAPSNIGSFRRDRFSVVPEITLQGGFEVFRNVTVFAGVTVMYWNDVLRPGDSIDRVLDTVNAVPTRPIPQFRDSDLWVGGVNFGVEFRR